MAKYVYPALFEANELGGYCVYFPDIPGCFTQGKDLPDAMDMAQDALCLMLYHHEDRGDLQNKVSPPTPINELCAPEDGFVTMIACDTGYYKRYLANKPVNKTVTIPAQLKLDAEKAGINFSQVLRNGLEQILQKQT